MQLSYCFIVNEYWSESHLNYLVKGTKAAAERTVIDFNSISNFFIGACSLYFAVNKDEKKV